MDAILDDQAIEAIYGKLKTHGLVVRKDQRLSGPDVQSVTVRSTLCGSELTLDAVIRVGHVQQVGWRARACSLGQATTGIVVRHLAELDAVKVKTVGSQLQAILKGRKTACDWPELELFTFAEDMPVRHESAMLPFRALAQLFKRASEKRGGA
jgi:NifU-like protein involved in Fe-S cluster formation